jgi:hypothetical protein
MAIALTGSNMAQLFSLISPFLLGFFIFMSSLFNLNIKGIIYLGGILIAALINGFLMGTIKESPPDPRNASIACGLVNTGYLQFYGTPSPSGVFIAFTIAYLVLPLYYNGQMNYVLLISLFALLFIDIIAKTYNGCTSYIGAGLGCLVGFIIGAAWYSLFKAAGYESLVYFNEMNSNKVMCSRPSKQTFKCSVYKHGELISSNTV